MPRIFTQPKALNRAQKEKLKSLGVMGLYLFGSRAEGIQNPLSDYDYAVLLPQSGHKRGGALYFSLYDLLSDISPRTLDNDVIDIIFLRDVGLELRFHVIRKGKVLFERDKEKRLEFEVQTQLLYCDYRPILDEIDRTILASIG